MKFQILSIILGLSAAAMAAPSSNSFPAILTIAGTTYSNVTLLRYTPATFTFRHATGVATLPIGLVNGELQAQLNYEPSKASEFLNAQHGADIQQQATDSATRQKATMAAEQQAFDDERQRWLVIGDELLPRGSFNGVRVDGTIWEKRSDGTIIDGRLVLPDNSDLFSPPDRIFIKNWHPKESVSAFVSVRAIRINPIEGMQTYDVGRVPTSKEWLSIHTK